MNAQILGTMQLANQKVDPDHLAIATAKTPGDSQAFLLKLPRNCIFNLAPSSISHSLCSPLSFVTTAT